MIVSRSTHRAGALICLLATICFMAGCGKSKKEADDAAAETEAPTPVTVETAVRAPSTAWSRPTPCCIR